MAYVGLRKMDHELSRGRAAWAAVLRAVVLRYLRLAPLVAVVVLFSAWVVPYWGSGPQWANGLQPLLACRKYWWSVVLFINNFVPDDDSLSDTQTCIDWTWYLANDFQFACLSTVLLALFSKISHLRTLKWRTAVVGLLVLCSVASSFVVAWNLQVGMKIQVAKEETNRIFNQFYVRPYVRAGPYFLGFLLGLVIVHLKASAKDTQVQAGAKATAGDPRRLVRMPSWLVCLTYIISLTLSRLKLVNRFRRPDSDSFAATPGCSKPLKALARAVTFTTLGAVLLGQHRHHQIPPQLDTPFVELCYQGLKRIVWSAALCAVTFTCVTGNAPLVDKTLSLPGFVWMSKLSYGVYLLHLIFVLIFFFQQRAPAHYLDFPYVMLFMMILTCAYVGAIIAALVVELPFASLVALAIGGGGRRWPAGHDGRLGVVGITSGSVSTMAAPLLPPPPKQQQQQQQQQLGSFA